jgi:hypothetical protein
VVYAVVKVVWAYNDEWYYPGTEGGQTETVYRSRERAQADADEQNEEEREAWSDAFEEGSAADYYEPAGLNQMELNDRVLSGRDVFDPPPEPEKPAVDDEGHQYHTFTPNEVPFYEVVEIELEDAP